MNDPIHELRAELMAVEPSPAFAAGVRARIAAEPAPRMNVMTILLGVAAAASVVVAVGIWSWGAAKTAAPAAPTVAAVPNHLAPVASATSRAEPVRISRPVRRAPRVAAMVVPSDAPLEVLVPSDQAAGVRRLLILHGAGRRFAMAPDGHAVDELTGALQEVPPIQIPQITIELLPGTAPGVGGKGK